MKLSNLSIKAKLTSVVLLSILLILIACVYNLQLQRTTSLLEREDKLSAQVEAAVSLVDHYYQQRTELGDERAKQQALSALQALRYDQDNYFWVLNQQLTVVMHPIKPELDGKSAADFKDGGGKYHWREMVDISRTPAQKGFLDYQWLSPEKQLKDKISYVQLFPEWNWILGSGLLVADIDDAFYATATKLGGVAVVIFGLLLMSGFAVSRNILVPLTTLIDSTHKIADGDLRIRMNMTRKDELGDVSQQIDKMLDKLQATLRAAHDSATQSSTMASHIAQASEEAATSVNAQHTQLEMLSTAMTEMSATISDVANNAENTSSSMLRVVNHATENDRTMAQTSEAISAVSHDIATSHALVTELQSGVDEISKVVEVIRDVSEQTNLLALNAAIEAARAGEQGRGFAVVADEVRNLASRTQQLTNEVQDTISKLTQQAQRTFEAMQNSNKMVEQSVASSVKTREQIKTILDEMHNANDRVAQIAAASEQQSSVATEMNENVTGIHLAANEVMQASQSLAKDSQHMAETAEHLSAQLQYFKV